MLKKSIFYKFIGLAALMSAIGVFSLYLWVISTAPTDRLERIISLNEGEEKSGGLLESGSLIDSRHIQTFLSFSNKEILFKKWLKEKERDGSLTSLENGKKYLVQKEINLPDLAINDCKTIYCLQKRLPFKEIPSVFWKGLIGIEDNRFLSHKGIDPKSILRAIVTDIKKMRLEQGGSTITQQLVKNLFYSNEKKFSRKIKEIFLSIYIESRYEKENILEAYLNEFEWGSLQGVKIKGLYSASIMYFGKLPDKISSFEASLLIGLLKGPYYYSPIKNINRLKKRTITVFNKLISLHHISSKDRKWSENEWATWHNNLVKKNKQRDLRSLWRVYKNKDQSFSSYEKFIFINKSMDVIKEIDKKIGNRDISVKSYFRKIKEKEFFTFYSKFERKKEVALKEEYHQVGSTLKPIIYSYIFENGKNPEDLVETKKIRLKLKSGIWSPREAHKNLPKEVTLEESLLKSYNRPIIRLSEEMGFEKLEEKLRLVIPRMKVPLSEYPAQLLGSIELSLEELFNIYKNFFLSECFEGEKKGIVVNLMSDPKKTTIRRTVGKRLEKLRFFGKTGTSNNGYDNWFISFDGSEIGIIWVGFEGVRKGEKFNLYGSNTAFQIFKGFAEIRGKRFNDLMCPEISDDERGE